MNTTKRKNLTLFLGNKSLTEDELQEIVDEINIGSVTLNVHGVKMNLETSTFSPKIDEWGVNFNLYIDEELFPETTPSLIDETLFFDVTGSVRIEELPHDIEVCTLFVKDLTKSNTASFKLKLDYDV